MASPADHEAYIAAAPETLRPLLKDLREQLSLALPDAEEIIAYKMPGFRMGSSIIAGYASFAKQCGLYVAPEAIKANAEEIAASGLKATKTGVTFSPKTPIPAPVVKRLAQDSRKANGF